MKKTISSGWIGVFTFNELMKSYCLENGGVRWRLDVSHEQADADVLLKRAENLFVSINKFDQQAKKP